MNERRDRGRVLYAGLHLLDRQLKDRHGRLCGKVDDLELTVGEDGPPYVAAILAGPGVLAQRLGRRRFGRWLEAFIASSAPSGDDPARIPMSSVSDIGATIALAVDADELATGATERWVRDHIVGHVPGSSHADG
jgi:hypothetical protein